MEEAGQSDAPHLITYSRRMVNGQDDGWTKWIIDLLAYRSVYILIILSWYVHIVIVNCT